MATLTVLTAGGGCRYYGWTGEDGDATEQARSAFERHRSLGYLAYELSDSRRGRYVDRFNADARLVVMHAPASSADPARGGRAPCAR